METIQLSTLGFVRELEAIGCTLTDEPDPDAFFADEQVYTLTAPNGTNLTVRPSQGITLVRIEGDERRHFLHNGHAAHRVLNEIGLSE